MLLLVIVSQLVISVIAFPVLRWLFKEALRADGMMALDMADFGIGAGFPLTLGLIFLIVVILFYLLIIQFTAILLLLQQPDISVRTLFSRMVATSRKVFRASSIPPALYALIIVPLAGFGFTSSLIDSISVPNFITGELSKELSTQVLMWVGFALVVWLNVRFALTIPLFALTDLPGTAAMKTSWKETRGLRSLPLLGAVLLTLLGTAVAVVALAYLTIIPTLIADQVWDQGSAVIAAYGLGVAQTGGVVLVGFGTATVAGILLAFISVRSGMIEVHPDHKRGGSKSWIIGISVVAVAALLTGTASISTMQNLSRHPDTVVFGHRGYTANAVENTIKALEDANAAGADIVEMDVMQTSDGGYIVMHDPNLGRLTGKSVAVKDLTLEEATSMTVHDRHGNSGQIPSLVEYATKAKEIGQPLLIEIKLSGAEGPDHVKELVELLEENDLLEGNIFHSLDAPSVSALKSHRPDLTIGYIMPLAGGGVPDTAGDFLVVEESFATSSLQDSVEDEGLGFVVWTPNEENSIRDRLRRDSDGIVTDKVELGVSSRQEMADETGLSNVLLDALNRFVLSW